MSLTTIPTAAANASTSTVNGEQPNPQSIPTYQQVIQYKLDDISTNYPIPDSYFPPLINNTLLLAATGQYTTRVPVWCHRQAGRFLPEFREVRSHIDFFSLCQNPIMACEVTLQPIRRYDFDGSIIFSDILVIPQCIGLVVEMHAGKGPVLPNPIKKPDDMQRLRLNISESEIRDTLNYVFRAVTLTRTLLNGVCPLIGFSGAPFTLMCYMTEGGGAKTYNTARTWFLLYPAATHQLLQLLTDVIVTYLIAQVEAGAQMLELFDTWASELSYHVFIKFYLPYLKQIPARIKQSLRDRNLTVVPITLFAKDSHFIYDIITRETQFDCMSLDIGVDRVHVRQQLNSSSRSITIQGNLEPCTLYANDDVIRSETRLMLDEFGTQNYIANLGHGMLPDHSPEKLGVFIDEVHRYSELLNQQRSTDTNQSITEQSTTV